MFVLVFITLIILYCNTAPCKASKDEYKES